MWSPSSGLWRQSQDVHDFERGGDHALVFRERRFIAAPVTNLHDQLPLSWGDPPRHVFDVVGEHVAAVVEHNRHQAALENVPTERVLGFRAESVDPHNRRRVTLGIPKLVDEPENRFDVVGG